MPDIGLISNGEPLSADYTHRRHDNCKRGRRIKEVKVSHKKRGETPGFVYDGGSAGGCRGPSGDYQGKAAVTKAVFRPAAGRVHRFVFC